MAITQAIWIVFLAPRDGFFPFYCVEEIALIIGTLAYSSVCRKDAE